MKGEEQVLPEETLQIAGCSDYIARTYINKQTGVTLSVLVAFGPAERVFGHSPVVCFPAFGYQLEASAERRNLPVDTTERRSSRAPTDALIYSKPNGGTDELVEVYYSFRHDGQWSPDASSTPQAVPAPSGDVQSAGRAADLSPTRPVPPGGPIEEFLAAMIGAIERRLDGPDGSIANGTSGNKPDTMTQPRPGRAPSMRRSQAALSVLSSGDGAPPGGMVPGPPDAPPCHRRPRWCATAWIGPDAVPIVSRPIASLRTRPIVSSHSRRSRPGPIARTTSSTGISATARRPTNSRLEQHFGRLGDAGWGVAVDRRRALMVIDRPLLHALTNLPSASPTRNEPRLPSGRCCENATFRPLSIGITATDPRRFLTPSPREFYGKSAVFAAMRGIPRRATRIPRPEAGVGIGLAAHSSGEIC